MKTLLMIEFGDVKAADIVEREIANEFGLHVRTERMQMPKVRARGWQVSGDDMLSEVARIRKMQEADFAIGILKDDLFTPAMNFVFGLATGDGRAAVVSVHRLVSGVPDVFRARLIKEITHELGHVLGLGHCDDVLCVMHFSNTLADTDTKGSRLCTRCRSKL